MGANKGGQYGHLGGEAGKKYGYLGGRKRKEPSEGEKPQGKQLSKRLSTKMNPQRDEPAAATVLQFKEFISEKLKERGLKDEDMTLDIMQEIQVIHFPGKRTRRLMQLWRDREVRLRGSRT